MNILPKKRWHVRTRENIARVRRDEAKAAEEEKQKQLRIEKAEKEARLEVLRKKARTQYESDGVQQRESDKILQKSDHINLFYELENDIVINKSNPEYEKEKKLETEKYEKQIGYLTYLGQDTNEISGNVSWYNRNPEERKSVVEEVAKKAKILEDPLRDIRKYLGTKGVPKIKQNIESVRVEHEKSGETDNSVPDYIFLTGHKKMKKKKKHKKTKKKKRKHALDSDSSDSDVAEEKRKKANLEKLRAERIKREMEERKRAQAVLQSLKGELIKEEKVNPEIEQKYSSQFNPHLAKQNILKSGHEDTNLIMEEISSEEIKDAPVLLVSDVNKMAVQGFYSDGQTLFHFLEYGDNYSTNVQESVNLTDDMKKQNDKNQTNFSGETLVNIDVNSDLLEEYMEVFVSYRCKECSYVSDDQKEFHHHCLQHLMKENTKPSLDHITYIYICSKCSKAFNSSEETKQHMITEHELKSNSFKCDEISEVVKTINVSIETSENQKIKKEFRKKKRKPQEIIQSIDPSADASNLNFSCTKRNCNYKFRREEDLNIHEKCHIELDFELATCKKKLFQCFECNELYNDWHGCCSHLYKAHEIDCDLLKCPICETYRTSIPLRLENHIRIHSDVRAFTCKQCGKTFKQASQLRNHCATHKEKDGANKPEWSRSKQCNICFKMYADSKSLKKHKEEVHSRLRPFVCNICGHASARKSMLILHQRQHTGQKPYECCVCSFRTADHNSLRKHIMRHTGVRPYKCPHCDYSAIQSGSYKNHMKLVHPNMEGMFVCNVCFYKTISEDNHVRHISDHLTGVIKDNRINGTSQKEKLPKVNSQTASDIISASLFHSGVELNEEKIIGLSPEFPDDGVSRTVDDEVIDTGGVTIPADDNSAMIECDKT